MPNTPAALLAVAALAGTSVASAAPTEWAFIASPNNRAATAAEAPLADRPIGAVDHTFFMTRTEITVEQYLPFARAYDAHIDHARYNDAVFLGDWISRSPSTGQLTITPGAEQFGIRTSWELAARYTNWLHNGQAADAAAFESGAYDTATFTTPNPQTTRAGGARFWLPSLDEWTKANYFDPNLNPGSPDPAGYWRSAGSSNDQLTPGLPADGGQTSAGVATIPALGAFALGQYPGVQSPWGLLETSGGVDEWLEDASGPNGRLLAGTLAGSGQSLVFDRLDLWSSAFIGSSVAGFRVASAVPAPAPFAIAVIAAGALCPRRYRRGHEQQPKN